MTSIPLVTCTFLQVNLNILQVIENLYKFKFLNWTLSTRIINIQQATYHFHGSPMIFYAVWVHVL